MSKIIKYLLIIVAVMIIFAIVGKKYGWIGQEKPIEVYVDTVFRRNIIEKITANGKIEPNLEIKVSADVSGEITELYVKEGEEVNKGQLLLKIKPNIYLSARERAEAAVNNAKANLDNARARLLQAKFQYEKVQQNYERNKKLWEEKTISLAEWENLQTEFKTAEIEVKVAKENVNAAEYAVKSAEASLKEANENLLKTSVYAPISGVITKLNVEKGERVVGTEMMAGTELLRIANLNQMRVKVTVNENDIVRVKIGDSSIIEIDAYFNQTFKGVVRDIAHSANMVGTSADQVTTFDVKIDIIPSSYKHLINSNNLYPLRPGMTANVEILTQAKYRVIALPIEAITSRIDKDTSFKEVVFKIQNKTAILQKIKTGIQDDSYIEIIEGVKENEVVIIGPFTAVSKKLANKSPIQIISKEKIKE